MTIKPTKRTNDAWTRFATWYGADALERKFGLTPPPEWCDVLERLDREKLAVVLANCKQKYPAWMPTLPEFEALVGQHSAPVNTGPSMQERLSRVVIRRCTEEQLRLPWTYLYRGSADRNSSDFEITGVDIPADGANPGRRFMVADLELGQ